MEKPKYSIGDDIFDVSTKKTYQIADIKIKDIGYRDLCNENGYWYGYLVNSNMCWVHEKDAIQRNKDYAHYMYPPLFKVGDKIRVKQIGCFGKIKEVHPADKRSLISYTVSYLFYKKPGIIGESGIEKLEEYPIGDPKFKIGETVYIPNKVEGGTVREIGQYNDTYRYKVCYNDELGIKTGMSNYFPENQLITFDRLSPNPKLNLEISNLKKMKEPKFKVGESVYVNKTGFVGTIINAPRNGNDAYYVKTGSSDDYYYEHELKPISEGKRPNIPIRSIKSLIKKSIVDPSSNQAEKKAIDFFVHSIHSMGDSYVGGSEYYVDEDNLKEFTGQLNIIERMAIEFYKKIKP